jgi:hypothetical protein
MCFNENYNIIHIGKYLCDIFSIQNDVKQENALLSFVFNFAVDYIIRKVQDNEQVLKYNGTHQFLVNADDVYY